MHDEPDPGSAPPELTANERRRLRAQRRAAAAMSRRIHRRSRRSGRRSRRRWIGLALTGLAVAILIPPCVYPVRGTATSGFFLRRRPDTLRVFDFELHRGIDLAGATGDPVRAAKSGRVLHAGWSESLGHHVVIEHSLRFTTVYGHLDSIVTRPGAFVVKGLALIGRVGSTGRSTGPHLHFEIRWNGRPLPPRVLLAFATVRRWILGF